MTTTKCTLAGRQVSGMTRPRELLRLGYLGRVWYPIDLPKGLPHGNPGAEPDDAGAGSVEGCPRAAAWSD
jgi:hypothetical protein